ncbi:MAG: serine/threonine-protein kinase [Burkholderiales bacterium]
MATLPMLGRYELTAELGKGAMGVVYKAQDPMLDRTVAIKTINMAEAEQEGLAEYEGRLYGEAKAAGGLNHPNIVIIYDIGKSDNLVYMAMEYVEGSELRDLLSEGQPLAPGKALDIGAQVADGLAYAHEHHVIHRDIKPANILITSQGRVKIADFGIARMRSNQTRTQTGVILGSPKYLSPEQVVGKRADHRSDIFSLGVILYQMLTGATPFNGENISALMYQITNLDPRPPSSASPRVPIMLDFIVAKALAKTPEQRYQTAAEFAGDLRQCISWLESSRQTSSTGMVSQVPYPAPAPAAAVEPSAPLTQESEPETPPAPAPTRGISRQFDSLEATTRLMLQFEEMEAQQNEATTTHPLVVQTPPRTPARPAERPWGRRETQILAATVVAALVIAAAIVLL